jgi:hypothetical protein
MPSIICPHPELAREARLPKGAQPICNAISPHMANKFFFAGMTMMEVAASI